MQTCSAETQIKQSLVDVGMVQECVVKALDVKNQEDKEEEMEIKKRATSVIVHGVAESDATDTSQRETEDIDAVVYWGGIRGYTAYTNLQVFLTAYTHLSDHK